MWSTPTQTKECLYIFSICPTPCAILSRTHSPMGAETMIRAPQGSSYRKPLYQAASFSFLPFPPKKRELRIASPLCQSSSALLKRQHPVFRNNLLSGNSEQSSSSYAGASQFLFQGHLFVLIEIHLHKVTVYVPVPPPVTRWRLGQCGMLSFTQMPAYIKRHVIGENYNRWRLGPF